jgi:hypothetical protein
MLAAENEFARYLEAPVNAGKEGKKMKKNGI